MWMRDYAYLFRTYPPDSGISPNAEEPTSEGN
jgi:hypothetical protein